MKKPKFDGVVVAVRYTETGQVDWVRMFERRGPTFSDWIMVKRNEIIARLKAGKRLVVGERKAYLAGTFEVSDQVKLVEKNGNQLLITSAAAQESEKDNLAGVPIL